MAPSSVMVKADFSISSCHNCIRGSAALARGHQCGQPPYAGQGICDAARRRAEPAGMAVRTLLRILIALLAVMAFAAVAESVRYKRSGDGFIASVLASSSHDAAAASTRPARHP